MMSFLFRSLAGRVILAAVVALVAIVAWILFSPLFIDNRVEESFPAALTSAVTTQGSSDEPMGEAAETLGNDSAGTEAQSVDSSSPTPSATLSGAFSDADRVHQGEGTAQVFEVAGGPDVLRFEDFRVTNGPDLFVWVTNVADPVADKGSIGDEGNYVEIARLKGNVGAQNYELPEGLDLSAYRHVVIWCRAFGVLFSAATLE